MQDPGLELGLPKLALQFDRIEKQLAFRGQLGILSVTILQREGSTAGSGWEDYENILREISRFLSRYTRRRMRRADRVLDPILAGNTFVVILAPPRKNRDLSPPDLSRVRARLERGIAAHLSQRLSVRAVEHFGVYVGEALLRHDPTVDCRRIVFRSLEAALADAIRQSQSELAEAGRHVKKVLECGRMPMVYQPVVDLSRRQVIGFEALARPPVARFPSPDRMFRAAQANGVLWELERMCREQALETAPEILDGQLLFLNIEPDAIHDPRLADSRFRARLRRAGLDPEQLVLEVTEHAAVRDFAAFRQAMQRSRGFGYRVAMDDVGSGYAGLQAIAELSPDFLKVDMSLVRNLHENPLKRELISSIHRFADRSGIRLVAEGVERLEEMESLAETGVRWAQGHLFARPTREASLPDWNLVLGRRQKTIVEG